MQVWLGKPLARFVHVYLAHLARFCFSSFADGIILGTEDRRILAVVSAIVLGMTEIN